jgi:hypothetical protein
MRIIPNLTMPACKSMFPLRSRSDFAKAPVGVEPAGPTTIRKGSVEERGGAGWSFEISANITP